MAWPHAASTSSSAGSDLSHACLQPPPGRLLPLFSDAAVRCGASQGFGAPGKPAHRQCSCLAGSGCADGLRRHSACVVGLAGAAAACWRGHSWLGAPRQQQQQHMSGSALHVIACTDMHMVRLLGHGVMEHSMLGSCQLKFLQVLTSKEGNQRVQQGCGVVNSGSLPARRRPAGVTPGSSWAMHGAARRMALPGAPAGRGRGPHALAASISCGCRGSAARRREQVHARAAGRSEQAQRSDAGLSDWQTYTQPLSAPCASQPAGSVPAPARCSRHPSNKHPSQHTHLADGRRRLGRGRSIPHGLPHGRHHQGQRDAHAADDEGPDNDRLLGCRGGVWVEGYLVRYRPRQRQGCAHRQAEQRVDAASGRRAEH